MRSDVDAIPHPTRKARRRRTELPPFRQWPTLGSLHASAPDAVTPSPTPSIGDPRRKVQARVALALLETLQRQDLPEEVLVDENLSVTLPRRLGLSNVVDAQIRRYREEARRNRRVAEPEVADLMRLVARRPDAAQVFLQVGRALAADLPAGWRRVLPRAVALRLARRRSRRVLADLFGGDVTGVRKGDATLELAHDLFFDVDPGGSACALVTGVIEGVSAASGRVALTVRKSGCRAVEAPGCSWEIQLPRPEIVPAVAGNSSAEDAADVEAGQAGREAAAGGEALSA